MVFLSGFPEFRMLAYLVMLKNDAWNITYMRGIIFIVFRELERKSPFPDRRLSENSRRAVFFWTIFIICCG